MWLAVGCYFDRNFNVTGPFFVCDFNVADCHFRLKFQCGWLPSQPRFNVANGHNSSATVATSTTIDTQYIAIWKSSIYRYVYIRVIAFISEAEHGYASIRPVLNTNDLRQDTRRPKTKKSHGTNRWVNKYYCFFVFFLLRLLIIPPPPLPPHLSSSSASISSCCICRRAHDSSFWKFGLGRRELV